MTYAYVPRDTILSLMSAVGLRDAPFSWDRSFLHEEDQVPDYIDMETIGAVGVWYNNGVGVYAAMTRVYLINIRQHNPFTPIHLMVEMLEEDGVCSKWL